MYGTVSTHNTYTKYLHKIISKYITPWPSGVYLGMHSGWFNILKSVNVIHHFNSLKKKIWLCQLMQTKHSAKFNIHDKKNSHQIMNGKELPQSQNKGICKTPIASIIHNGKTLDIFPLGLGKNRSCPLSLILLNILQEALVQYGCRI